MLEPCSDLFMLILGAESLMVLWYDAPFPLDILIEYPELMGHEAVMSFCCLDFVLRTLKDRLWEIGDIW